MGKLRFSHMAIPSRTIFLTIFLIFPFSHGIYADVVPSLCHASKNPAKCEAALAGSNRVAQGATPLEAIQAMVSICSQNLKTIQAKTKQIADGATGEAPNANLTISANLGLKSLQECENRINQTTNGINKLLEQKGKQGRIKDLRAWMSAALAHEYNIRSGYQKYVNISLAANKASAMLDSLMELNIDTLSMIRNYDIFGNNLTAWGVPVTERDGFFEDRHLPGAEFAFWKVANDKKDNDGGHRFGSKFDGGVPVNSLKPDVTVCKDGCDYKSIQEAVNMAPDHLVNLRFVVHIKEGVYVEKVRVPLEKTNLVFLGDGMGKTVITGKDNVGLAGTSTFESSTVGVIGDRFMASGLTIENTAGSDGQQAVAFRSDSDLSVIENCEFIGNQDTLYVKTARQYYKSCRIVGNIDFIFGNSASYFQDCLILVAPRTTFPEKGDQNPISAHGRTDPSQSTGFVFEDCVINGTDEFMAVYNKNPSVHKSYLARPWKEYARTVFIRCLVGSLIDPEGYMPWSGDVGLKTLFYGEYDNSGPGANRTKRVLWSSQIAPEHAGSYSVQNFIQGNVWIPSAN
ncbi:hypothetical protein Leryth_007696 [Lithospermum erythrorhizon]|uniref:pectinesterase n=1 Tax=Lithospermum erythrorhizon TaxID=34254 RepID=A0AAV3QJ62_LITER|nr:hypothetical protein Leryth_007696 [Lithospermum erythrorhizon]